MTIEICMPALSESMESGSLASWLVKEGDVISTGDVIAEIETDKAMMEVEAISDGVVGKILVGAGTEDIPVGTPIAILLEDGEDTSDMVVNNNNAVAATQTQATIAVVPESIAMPTATLAAPPSLVTENTGRIKASPLARRTANQIGIGLSAITGTGPDGRIIKRDVQHLAPSLTSTTTPPVNASFTQVKLSKMRKVIASRLSQAKQTIPHFYLTIDVELDRLLAQKKGLKVRLADRYVGISINDLVIRAVALALKKVPAANVQYAGDTVYQYEHADISVAVAIEGGLVTPVIRGADTKNVVEIAGEMRDLANRAREGKLTPEEYQGGTFSVSNLGKFGIREFSAIINPPQGAILAIGAGEKRAVIRDGHVIPATMMTCTLSCDHRVIDGAVGAEFLDVFKSLLEGPLTSLW